MRLGFVSIVAALAMTGAVAATELPERVVLKIGYSATSSWQVVGRLVVAHLGKHLPGNPTVELEGVDGGRGMQLLRQLAETEPGDGSVLGMVSASLMQSYVLTPEVYDFDPSGGHWVGALVRSVGYCVAREGSTTSLTDEGVILGATGKLHSFYATAATIKELLNETANIIVGFQNENELMAALDRSEIDAYCGPTRSTYEREGRKATQKILAGFGNPEQLAALGVPDLYAGITGPDRQAVDLVGFSSTLFAPIVLPPSADAETVALYRAAFDALNADPTFQAEMLAVITEYVAVPGEALQAEIDGLLATDPMVVARARELIE